MLNTNKWVAQSKKYTANSKNLLLMKSKSNHICFLFCFSWGIHTKMVATNNSFGLTNHWAKLRTQFKLLQRGQSGTQKLYLKIWSDTEFARSCHLSVEHRPFIIWDWPFTIRDWLSVVRESIFPFYSPPPPLMLPFVHTYV